MPVFLFNLIFRLQVVFLYCTDILVKTAILPLARSLPHSNSVSSKSPEENFRKYFFANNVLDFPCPPKSVLTKRSLLRFYLISIIDPLHHEKAGHWTFDDYTLSNSGLGADTLATSETGDGIVLETPDRDSPVLQCKTENCLTIDNTNMPCLK